MPSMRRASSTSAIAITRSAQNLDPTITVQGDFTGGGNNMGVVRDNQDRFELENDTTLRARHACYRVWRRASALPATPTSPPPASTATTFTRRSTAYTAGTPSEYDVTVGKANSNIAMFDAGLFYQDDYKVRPNFTLSYGIRYESQNRIDDHNDWAPRVSIAWAPNRGSKPAKTVIRAGYGWFYDRFGSNFVLDAIRNNGINQQQYVVKNPSFTSNAPPASVLAARQRGGAHHLPGRPALPRIAQHAGRVRAWSTSSARSATTSVTYVNSRGIHQYISDNINAFLPGTYDPATGTGTRPNGINENIYQFQSEGIYNQNQVTVNYTVRAKRVSLFGFYMLNFANADTSGATYFPTNQLNPARRLRPRQLRYPQPLPAGRQPERTLRRLIQPHVRG